jgi:hypothetical protein
VGVLISLPASTGRIRLSHRLLHLPVTLERSCLLLKYCTELYESTRSCRALKDDSTTESPILQASLILSLL